jgi:hypothetical protein
LPISAALITRSIRLVGQFQVGGAAVGLAEDGHRLHAELAAGADHAQGDLTAIGDQDPFEHGCRYGVSLRDRP